jgi:monofunctional biosynthetic peptidoglycan transglycosylase
LDPRVDAPVQPPEEALTPHPGFEIIFLNCYLVSFMNAAKSSAKKPVWRKPLKVLVTISLCVQVCFIIYFFYKVAGHMQNGNMIKLKLTVVLLFMGGVVFIYFKWLRRNEFIRKTVAGVFRFILYSHLLSLLYILLLKWIHPPVTITQLTHLFSYGLKRDYVSFSNISYNAKLSVIAGEDQLFPDHNGFDWNAIERSMNPPKRKRNKKKKLAPGAGASTISQQVAKNVFLWQGKSYFRKGLEAYFTFMIETVWGKKRILDIYLNCIEMGKGIFGIEAAAQAYFNKPASQLKRQEAAMITACFPNPQLYSVKPVSPFVNYKSGWILGQMNNIEEDEDIQEIIRN